MTRWKEKVDDNTVDFEDVHCIHETTKAIQVVIDGECRWVPKSLVHDDSEVYKKGDIGTLTLPEWFCIKEGWV